MKSICALGSLAQAENFESLMITLKNCAQTDAR